MFTFSHVLFAIAWLAACFAACSILFLLIGLGAATLRFARFGRAGDAGARCAACGYALINRCARCPECGAELETASAVIVGHTRPGGWRMAFVPCLGIALAVWVIRCALNAGPGLWWGPGPRPLAVERVGGLTGEELVQSALATPPDPPPWTSVHDLYGEIARRSVRAGEPGSRVGVGGDLWVRAAAVAITATPAYIEALAVDAERSQQGTTGFSWTGIPVRTPAGWHWSRGGAEELFVVLRSLQQSGFDAEPILRAFARWRVTAIEVGARGNQPPSTLLAVSLDATRQSILAGFHAEEVVTRVDGKVIYEGAMTAEFPNPYEGAYAGTLVGLNSGARATNDSSDAAPDVDRGDICVAFRAHSVFGSGGPREPLFELVDPPIERVQLSCAAAPEAAARAIAETLTIAEFDARTQALSVSNGPAQSALRNWLSISPSIGAEVRLEVNWNGRTFDLGPGKIADSSDQISPRIRQWAMPIVLRPSLEQRRAAVSEASSEHAELVITLVPMTNEQLVAWLVRAAGEDGRIPKKEYLDREVSVRVPLRLATTENEAR